MSPDEMKTLFTRRDGTYAFARWGRPIAPVVFGVEESTLGVVKGAIEAVVTLAGHRMAATDPDLGANLVVVFLRDWEEVRAVPGLAGLLPDRDGLVARLEAQGATRYGLFRFDAAGAIRARVTLVRIDGAMAALPAEVLALDLAVRAILDWSERAFADRSALVQADGRTILRPEIAAVIRAAYAPTMPVAAGDASHALRLVARVGE